MPATTSFVFGPRGGRVVTALGFRQRGEDGFGILANVVWLTAIGFGDTQKRGYERRAAVTLLSREICSAPERFCVAIEEHRQRPATLLAETVQCAHVDSVDIGTLLAIDFDIDEELVHHLGGAGILETLCAITWHQWQAAYPTESRIGLSVRFASARASGPQAHQWTGLF